MSTTVAALLHVKPQAAAAPAPASVAETSPSSARVDTIPNGGLPSLAVPRAHAVTYLRKQYEKGVAIYRLRIHHVEDLDECRGKKLGWTIETTDLLTRLFGCAAVADSFNDWVGKIHPEYADFGNFVHQFYEEMTHRLKRLRDIQNRLDAPRGSIAPGLSQQPVELQVEKPDVTAMPAAASEPALVRSSGPAEDRSTDRVLLALDAQAEEGRQVAEFLEQLGVSTVASGDLTMEDASSHRFALLPTLPDVTDTAAVFRLGLTAGQLGPERVCVLNATGSGSNNTFGLAHVNYDAGGGWRLDLARLLKRAGFEIDLNRLCG